MSDNSLYATVSSILAVYDITPPLDGDGRPMKLEAEVTSGFISSEFFLLLQMWIYGPTCYMYIVFQSRSSVSSNPVDQWPKSSFGIALTRMLEKCCKEIRDVGRDCSVLTGGYDLIWNIKRYSNQCKV